MYAELVATLPLLPDVRSPLFDRILHSRMPRVSRLLRLKLLRACDQWHSSRVFTPLTGWHGKFRHNTSRHRATLLQALLWANGTVHVFRQDLHSRMSSVPTPARFKLLHVCGQWYSSRVHTISYRCRCKLRPKLKAAAYQRRRAQEHDGGRVDWGGY
jgi:hypothetical protein